MNPNVAGRPAILGRRVLLGILALLGLVSGLVYATIAWLSLDFVHGQGFTERPILKVLALFGAAFVCYLLALWVAVRARDDRSLLWLIVLTSIAFRAVLLWSGPIQEVDIYRYLWDGEVTACGVSPFRYSPEQVLAARADTELPDDLRRLVARRDASASTATILSRVHYGELPTVYPPVSQAVFAFAAWITPDRASVLGRLVGMKACLVLFDLATLGVVIGLLRRTGRHLGWSVAYGWCPLVVKEFANSGHLDAVAVFLSTLAVFVALHAMFGARRRALGWMTLAALLLALAVGAKLYPAVLFPWFAAASVRRLGWRRAVAPLVILAALSVVVLGPMLPWNAPGGSPIRNARAAEPQDPSAGLKAFLGRWEINDFLFLVAVENVKPGDGPESNRPWFVVTPHSWRERVAGGLGRRIGVKPPAAAFLLTRAVTGVAFLALAVILAWRAARSHQPVDWLQAAFLTLAWFWLLSPAQNPWYWTWAMPLLPFARARAWLAVSGLAMIYYLRFWLLYHWPEEAVLATGYNGKLFFDYVVTWLEFGPWFLWLGLECWIGRRSHLCGSRFQRALAR